MTRGRILRGGLSLLLAAIVAMSAKAPAAVASELAAPAWSLVGVTGPTVVPPVSDEIQNVFVGAEGGTFTLTTHHVAARGREAKVSFFTVSSFVVSSGAFAVGQGIEGEGIQAGTTITACSPSCAAPTSLTLSRVAVAQTTGASLVATDAGVETTSALDFDAGASDVETALNSLSLISAGGGSVSVVGGPGDAGSNHPYSITFDGGPLADLDAPQLSVNPVSLTGSAHTATVTTPVDGGPGTATLAIYAQNIGGLEATGTVTVTAELPANVVINGSTEGEGWNCTGKAGQSKVICKSHEPVAASLVSNSITVPIRATGGIAGTEEAILTISGGGAEPETYSAPITVSAIPAMPGIRAFKAGAYGADGHLSTQAGAHPFTASSAIFVNTIRAPNGNVVPAGEPRTIKVDLPPGFLGNPVATPTCEPAECVQTTDPIVGIADPLLQTFGENGAPATVHNVLKPYGSPGKFEFVLVTEHVNALGSLRTDEDYGLTVTSPNTPQVLPVFGTFFTFWGAPADPVHTPQRCLFPEVHSGCAPSTGPNTAFLTNPTDCAGEVATPPTSSLSLDTWLLPGVFSGNSVALPAVTGCDQLKLEGDFKLEPTSSAADSPTSSLTELSVPSEGLTNPEKLTTPELKKNVIELPEGVVLNAAGADGLQACTEQQIGFKGAGFPMPNPMRFSKEPNQCPDASKIGTGELTTALLEETLQGNLYLAAQGSGNPFGSIFALYLVIEDPASGIVIKLPGRVDLDHQTGRITVTFENLPQIPFTNLKLDLKGGDRSALATPTTCGRFTTTTEMTPWSAPESGPPLQTDEEGGGFEINSGPGGSACAKTPAGRPFDVGWNAGAASTAAGASSPFNLQVTRPDGSQELESLELKMPKGVTASLAGIPSCSEAQIQEAEGKSGAAEQAHPSCPSASQVGTTLTGAGVGPTPFYTSGRLYLAGAYKGAPVSVVAITPAVAGPLDLGNVVLRTALYVNPETAQITAQTDPLPEFLKGVQLRLRDVRISLDHSDWTLNPTSCEPGSVDLVAHGNSGAVAERSARFQVGGCENLKFAPKLTVSLKGSTRRNGDPALTAVLNQPPGQANIAKVSVALPHSEFLEQGHIRTNCTRVQFSAGQCPAGSIYGHAEAFTPLLDQPLTGPVYLRSSSHRLPDLVAALKGPANQPVEIDLDGRIDSVNGGIRTTFETVPDAPVSKFVLRMQGGKKSLLVNSTNVCQGTHKATVEMTGQNAKPHNFKTALKAQCGKQKPKKKSAKK
jgi:hypothetical protein